MHTYVLTLSTTCLTSRELWTHNTHYALFTLQCHRRREKNSSWVASGSQIHNANSHRQRCEFALCGRPLSALGLTGTYGALTWFWFDLTLPQLVRLRWNEVGFDVNTLWTRGACIMWTYHRPSQLHSQLAWNIISLWSGCTIHTQFK